MCCLGNEGAAAIVNRQSAIFPKLSASPAVKRETVRQLADELKYSLMGYEL
ncbi:hypothetical protein GGD38_000225 [Chitinophagaceae bacterium OAS944]|nr:hypothetical protein [Chitinophagaceae bacterium OAS944]